MNGAAVSGRNRPAARRNAQGTTSPPGSRTAVVASPSMMTAPLGRPAPSATRVSNQEAAASARKTRPGLLLRASAVTSKSGPTGLGDASMPNRPAKETGSGTRRRRGANDPSAVHRSPGTQPISVVSAKAAPTGTTIWKSARKSTAVPVGSMTPTQAHAPSIPTMYTTAQTR